MTLGMMFRSLPLSRCVKNPNDPHQLFFNVPYFLQLNVTLPKNTVKVFAELYASGNGNEEFWVGTT